MPVGPTSRIAVTADLVARRNEIAELLEQAAVEACLFDCANEEERQFVRGCCVRERRDAMACGRTPSNAPE